MPAICRHGHKFRQIFTHGSGQLPACLSSPCGCSGKSTTRLGSPGCGQSGLPPSVSPRRTVFLNERTVSSSVSLLRRYISACKCWDRREEMPAKAVRLRRHCASQGLTHCGIAPDVREEQRSERIERLPAPIAQALSARRQRFSHSIISDEATADCWHPLLSDAALGRKCL